MIFHPQYYLAERAINRENRVAIEINNYINQSGDLPVMEHLMWVSLAVISLLGLAYLAVG